MIHRPSIFVLLLLCRGLAAVEPPVVPVGLDAYRQWERWPYQRIGVRAYMRSTYDRRGGNEGADASHFLYQLAEDRNVALDVQGPGILYFTRYNHWHGSPWHYEVDGLDHIIQEASTADPLHPKAGSVFLPERLFPSPLTATWSTTQGADLSWVPIPFEKSFRLAYSRTHYGTGYFIYHQYVPGTRLSQRIRAWNERSVPDRNVLDLIARAGSDLLSPSSSRAATQFLTRSGELSLESSETRMLTELTNAPSMLRSLQFSVPKQQALAFGKCRLRIYWDGSPTASVDAPVALFFGAGTLYNRDNREYLVRAFPVNVRFASDKVFLACYFPMPFFHSARIELLSQTDAPLAFQWLVRFAPFKATQAEVGYFHATYRDHANPEPGRDLVLLDTQEAESGGDWSGQFVGTSFIFSDRAVLNTLEGDPRFFFDDSQTPQAYGTGTEEWAGGGDYWGGHNMTLAFAGHPTGARSAKEALCEDDKIESAYRFLLADLMPFGKRARIQLEHGGQDESTEHYQTVAYWYGINSPSLVKTDELKIGDPASESMHTYSSPEATASYSITSRYELGVDTLNGKEIYPATADIGRRTTGTSEFTLRLTPGNLGALLRRKLDYQYPNQRAEVFVAPVKNGRVGAFQPCGVWYLAGGNTCVYSNPKEELGPAQHIAQTSNRRFRDDEFLVSRMLTQGREAVRIRIKFSPVRIPLYQGQEPPEAAWTELKYQAFCFVMPNPCR